MDPQPSHQAPSPGLGLFSRLPRELRDLIWNEFQPRNSDPGADSHPVPKTDTRICKTSKQIYHGVSEELYRKRTMSFNILGASPKRSRRIRGQVRWASFWTGIWPMLLEEAKSSMTTHLPRTSSTG